MSQQSSEGVVIRLQGLRVTTSIGILAHEVQQRQEIVIHMTVRCAPRPEGTLIDGLEVVLDYRLLRDIGIDECTNGHINMLETLVARIADRVMALPRTLSCEVEVVKPHVFEDADGVSVALTRRRESHT